MAVSSQPIFPVAVATDTSSPTIDPPGGLARADVEKRCLMAGLELRASRSGRGPGTIVGYAAVFEKFSADLGGFYETIRRGAFAGVLSNDVRALKNHDPAYLLGRLKSGTLRLNEDELGLRFEVDLPDTQTGRDTATEVERGDLDGASFAFITELDDWDWSGDKPIRTLIKIRELFDVGPVTYPAYTDTSAAMRSLTAGRSITPPPSFPPASVYQARLRVAAAF
jgi:HK97 family phage prohead protease